MKLLILNTLVLALFSCSRSPTVEANIECSSSGGNCVLQNYLRGPWLDRKPCTISKLFSPTTEAELVQAVAFAVKNSLKLKVVSRNAHTINKFACPEAGVLISTSKLNSTISVDKQSMTATADAGVLLRDLLDSLANQGVALQQTTAWDGVSVSGMVSTGAHGSSLQKLGGGTHEYLVGMRIVVAASAAEGYAKVVTLSPEDDQDTFNAARISLGVLGAISRVSFAVQPIFKRSVTLRTVNESTFDAQDLLKFAREHEFGEVTWYPSVKKFILKQDDRVNVASPGDGRVVLGVFVPFLAASARRAREADEAAQAAGNSTFYCSSVQNTVSSSSVSGGGFSNDGKNFTGFPVVGFNHRIQSSGGCQYTYENQTNLALPEDQRLVCLWDYEARGSFWFHISVSIALEDVGDFLNDVKMLRSRISSRLCPIQSALGLQMRFVKSSEAYLGARQDSAQIEFIVFRDRRPGEPQTYQDVVEEIEQMLVVKYKGRPHFGKNRAAAFKDVGKKVRDLSKFLQVRRKMDPEGWFSSDWSDAVLGIKGSAESLGKGCAIEGLCVCREDMHCAPEKGFFCRAGLVFTNARVCRKAS